jgi:glucokinase
MASNSRAPAPVIAADIGGTHARFACVSPGLAPTDVLSFNTRDFASFEAVLGDYLARLAGPRPETLALGAAGPLVGEHIALTNGTWVLDAPTLAKAFGFRSVVLVNDLVAYGAGAIAVPTAELACIAPAPKPPKTALLIALGTGLGAAYLRRRDGGREVFPTEAGHVNFAPETEEEDRLLVRLRTTDPRPSFEHVISGSGLARLYRALAPDAAEWPTDGAQLMARAEQGDLVATNALRLATVAFATFARDLVLAHGGADAIIIGGGLGRALERFWRTPEFQRRLRRAPAMPLSLERLGIYLVAESGLPLKGAAELAWGGVECASLARFDAP